MGRSQIVLAGPAYAAPTVRPFETHVGTQTGPQLGGLTTDQSAAFLWIGSAGRAATLPAEPIRKATR